jgi:HSP20 family protein
MIRERAYHNFQNRESNDGDSLTDWLQAKSQILTHIDLELKDQKRNIVVEGDLKGFSPGEIEIELKDGQLRVSGSHKESSASETDGIVGSKSESMYFYRSLNLPTAVDADKIHAKLHKNGKLKLTLPKKTPTRAKKKTARTQVPIRSG